MTSSSSRETCPSAERKLIAGDGDGDGAAVVVERVLVVVVVVEQQKALPDGLMSSGCRGTAKTGTLILSAAGNNICATGSMDMDAFSSGDFGCLGC